MLLALQPSLQGLAQIAAYAAGAPVCQWPLHTSCTQHRRLCYKMPAKVQEQSCQATWKGRCPDQVVKQNILETQAVTEDACCAC